MCKFEVTLQPWSKDIAEIFFFGRNSIMIEYLKRLRWNLSHLIRTTNHRLLVHYYCCLHNSGKCHVCNWWSSICKDTASRRLPALDFIFACFWLSDLRWVEGVDCIHLLEDTRRFTSLIHSRIIIEEKLIDLYQSKP